MDELDEAMLIAPDLAIPMDDEVEDDGLGPMTWDEVETLAAQAIRDAVDFIDSDIAPGRLEARKYYDGYTKLGEEEGRSKVVATKVRDAVRAVKPSLLRIFLTHPKPVEFLPTSSGSADQADQQTNYVRYLFRKNSGYLTLLGIIDDALKSKQAITKAYVNTSEKTTHHILSDLTAAQLQELAKDPELTFIAQSAGAIDNASGEQLYDIEVQRTVSKRRPALDLIPPENFFVTSGATDIAKNPFCVGHVEELPVGDVMAMGFDMDAGEIADLGGLAESSAMRELEDEQRRKYSRNRDNEQATGDPSTKKVAIYCAYIRMDPERSGRLMTYEVFMGGENLKLLRYDPVDDNPFAVHEIDPDPHAFHGSSLADLVMTDQDTSTSILRGVVDNIHATNNPRLAAVENQVNMDDVLNNELGAVIRVRAPGMLQAIEVPFSAGQALPVLQYHDQMIEQKTGVTRASMGLDPDALQSTTKDAAANTIAAAAGQVEVMARNLAETGMTRMYQQLLKLSVETASGEEIMEVNGAYYPVDPRSWATDSEMQVNVGLGTGDVDRKVGALSGLFQTMMGVWAQYGPQNGVVTLTGMHNCLVDLVALQGVHNTARYITPMTPQREQQLLATAAQQAAQAAQGAPTDPTAQALVAGEQIKAQVKSAADAAKSQIDVGKALMDDDFRRDKMAQDFALEQARLQGELGVQADEQALRMEIERQRIASAPAPGGSQ